MKRALRALQWIADGFFRWRPRDAKAAERGEPDEPWHLHAWTQVDPGSYRRIYESGHVARVTIAPGEKWEAIVNDDPVGSGWGGFETADDAKAYVDAFVRERALAEKRIDDVAVEVVASSAVHVSVAGILCLMMTMWLMGYAFGKFWR